MASSCIPQSFTPDNKHVKEENIQIQKSSLLEYEKPKNNRLKRVKRSRRSDLMCEGIRHDVTDEHHHDCNRSSDTSIMKTPKPLTAPSAQCSPPTRGLPFHMNKSGGQKLVIKSEPNTLCHQEPSILEEEAGGLKGLRDLHEHEELLQEVCTHGESVYSSLFVSKRKQEVQSHSHEHLCKHQRWSQDRTEMLNTSEGHVNSGEGAIKRNRLRRKQQRVKNVNQEESRQEERRVRQDEDLPWTEKYRPRGCEEMVGNSAAVKKLYRKLSAMSRAASRRKCGVSRKSVTLTRYFRKTGNKHTELPHDTRPPDDVTRDESKCKQDGVQDKTDKTPPISLVLFEEVDIVFEEDVGFFAAIKTLMSTTKRPIILTTNAQPTFKNAHQSTFDQKNKAQSPLSSRKLKVQRNVLRKQHSIPALPLDGAENTNQSATGFFSEVDSLACFFDTMSFVDSYLCWGACRKLGPLGAKMVDGLLDEPGEDVEMRTHISERCYEILAVVEGLAFHKCRTEVCPMKRGNQSKVWKRVQRCSDYLTEIGLRLPKSALNLLVFTV
ncbi:ATPase family, AAA domain containing 5b isoform X1 [Silurus asotus]|uniref:ATPase family, AAA domain containing 5b isoform X1 n=1 Tax=Silurus asotus TaxID=30991 RepID=A0AAD5ACZ5_SILAS|nr:ATPase family, AAA domain containing 5b isoform X1 [Silurus asotus]